VDAGYSGHGYSSRTRVRLSRGAEVVFQPAEFPELKSAPDVSGTGMQRQSALRAGFPANAITGIGRTRSAGSQLFAVLARTSA
jgi:hypothetical protein